MPTVYTTFEPTRALDVSAHEAGVLDSQGLLVPAPEAPSAPAAPAKTVKGGE